MNVEDFSILHISDIHKGDNSDYGVLFDSLVANNDSYASEGIPPIRFIVVSGDLVRGSLSDDLNVANIEIDKQYEEVEEFLEKLVEKFLDNDRRRMVIVPGNHDINRCISKRSMTPVKGKYIKDAKEAYCSHPQMYNGEFRWSWKDLQFYKITGMPLYETRFDNFVKFYDRFFSCVGRSYPKEREKEAYMAKFEDYNIAFACYNSNCGLDHLNPMGFIHGKAIHSITSEVAKAHNDGMLVIGVWHHHVYGYPYSNNYLDRNIVRYLCNNHIRVGLFGHQHKCEVVEELRDLSSDKDDKMLLVCSGTLFGDKESMLPGEKRQYNIISVKMLGNTAVIEIRCREDKTDDSPHPIWRPMYLSAGNTFINYKVELEKVNVENIIGNINDETKQSGDFKKGFVKMKSIKESSLALRFSDEYLQKLSPIDDADIIIENVKTPMSYVEYAYLLEAHTSKYNIQKVQELLQNPTYINSNNKLVIYAIYNAQKKLKNQLWRKQD